MPFSQRSSPDNLGPAVEGSDVKRRHIVLALLVEVSLSGDIVPYACHIVALHRLDHVHPKLHTAARRTKRKPHPHGKEKEKKERREKVGGTKEMSGQMDERTDKGTNEGVK